MSERTSRLNRGERIVVGVVLLLAAALMFFMAWQCVTTVEYGLYQKNQSYYAEKASHYDEYIAKAAECREQATGEYAEIYARRALDWEEHAQEALRWGESAKEAEAYLTQKKLGHICLAVVGVLGIAGAAWCFIPRKKKNKDRA